jgi:hypothetical protein
MQETTIFNHGFIWVKVGPIKCRQDTSFPGQRLHLNLVGPIRTVRKYRYMSSLQDAFSRKVWLKPLMMKSTQEVAKNLISVFLSDGSSIGIVS